MSAEWCPDLVNISRHEVTATARPTPTGLQRKEKEESRLGGRAVGVDRHSDRYPIPDHASQQTLRQSHHGCQGRNKSVKYF